MKRHLSPSWQLPRPKKAQGVRYRMDLAAPTRHHPTALAHGTQHSSLLPPGVAAVAAAAVRGQ